MTKDADQRGRGQQPRQRRKHDAVVRAQPGAVLVPPQHRDLVAQDQQVAHRGVR